MCTKFKAVLEANQLNFSSLVRVLSILGLFVILGACAPISPTAELDQKLLNRLCNASDRHYIKRTVLSPSYARTRVSETSAFCASISELENAILKERYEFYECSDGPWIAGENKLLKVYRFKLKQKGDDSCEEDSVSVINKVISRIQSGGSEFKNLCVGVELDNQFKSRFVQLSGSGQVNLNGEHIPGHPPNYQSIPGYISYSRTQVVDLHNNETIAERRFYWLYPFAPKNMDLKNGKINCKSNQSWVISDVVIPLHRSK